jgi:hypothetical protein
VSSIEPDHDGGEMNSAKEINGSFIITHCYSAVLFQPGKEILD